MMVAGSVNESGGFLLSFKINDPVFNNLGEPGFVRKIDPNKQKVFVNKDRAAVKHELRHGYIRAMGPDVRGHFNEFMDKVKDEPVPEHKIRLLQDKIIDLEGGGGNPENRRLLKYIKSELAHIMNTYHVHPRKFEAKEDQLY